MASIILLKQKSPVKNWRRKIKVSREKLFATTDRRRRQTTDETAFQYSRLCELITEKYLFIKYRKKIGKCKPALKMTSFVLNIGHLN